jgi:hypothetical protein
MNEANLKQGRLECANALIVHIGGCGRQFFLNREKNSISYFWLDTRGRLWYWDAHSRRSIYTHYAGRWRYFCEGGTLEHLVRGLRDFIQTGKRLPRSTLGPWPEWCDDDLWGYGEDMECVREAARILGVTL